jgi:phage terminase large subunit-like protein
MTSSPACSTSPDPWSAVAAALQAEITRRAAETRLATYRPYPKQREFHALGATHRIRALFGGNQLGKTYPTTAEDAMHLTGAYPDWWPGHRFDRPIRCWAAGVTSFATRDTLQTKLIGPPEVEAEWGTGWLPKRRLVSWNRALGTPNLLDNVVVRHQSGGVSTLWFKSYEQGRLKWQGPTIDLVHFDEEPPWDIWSEGMTRTNAVPDSRIIASFTPLLGMSEVVRYLLAGRDPRQEAERKG